MFNEAEVYAEKTVKESATVVNTYKRRKNRNIHWVISFKEFPQKWKNTVWRKKFSVLEMRGVP